MTKIKEIVSTPVDSVIKSENQYIDKLSDIAKTSGATDFNLLVAESKTALETKEQEIKDYINTTSFTDENKDDKVEAVIELWNQYKDLVKNAECTFAINSLEVRTLDKKLHNAVEYDTETLFYGLHLKKHFIDLLPATKAGDFEAHEMNISFSLAIALYHVLSTLKVKGLNKENFAFAHLLYKLSEISKVYQYYDGISLRLNQSIGQWTMGLNTTQVSELDSAIKEVVKSEVQA